MGGVASHVTTCGRCGRSCGHVCGCGRSCDHVGVASHVTTCGGVAGHVTTCEGVAGHVTQEPCDLTCMALSV